MPTIGSNGVGDGSRSVRIAAGIAAGWGVVLLAWAAYNCFAQVGFGTFVEGIFYYGVSDGAARAETNSLNYAVVYLAAAWLMFTGRGWARGVVVGVALVEGYNRLRSLTGALFDAPQRAWFTGTVEGWLKLATFGAGLLVTTALTLIVLRSLAGADAAPAAAPWSPAPFQPPFPQPAFGQPPAQPAFGQPPQAWPPAQQQFGQPPFGAPQFGAPPAQPSFGQPPQAWAPTPPQQPQPQQGAPLPQQAPAGQDAPQPAAPAPAPAQSAAPAPAPAPDAVQDTP
ncbi:hypothetical protein [Kitasatospora sp. NPDC059571]|uniref:hypothetical protein n=1 Tax=Kitasatospora sp. NPDC059571 TaxID=3346871 RepID=UPI0036980567